MLYQNENLMNKLCISVYAYFRAYTLFTFTNRILREKLALFRKKMQVKLKETRYLLEYIFLITLV